MTERKIRILVADDHAIVRRGLVSLLSLNKSFEVIGEVTDGRMAVEQALEKRPDVVLMDIGMPVLNGLEATEQLNKLAPDVKVLVLSAYDNEEYIDRVAKSGAMGYVLKNSSVEQLSEAIVTVDNGQKYFSPPITTILVDRYNKLSPVAEQTERNSRLTQRERQVLQLLAEGKSHREIAEHLFIAVRTVDTHTNNIMQKLEIHDTAGLVTYAIKNGIIILPK
jgi:DNA-binding NarL/FixJ family response regulator